MNRTIKRTFMTCVVTILTATPVMFVNDSAEAAGPLFGMTGFMDTNNDQRDVDPNSTLILGARPDDENIVGHLKADVVSQLDFADVMHESWCRESNCVDTCSNESSSTLPNWILEFLPKAQEALNSERPGGEKQPRNLFRIDFKAVEGVASVSHFAARNPERYNNIIIDTGVSFSLTRTTIYTELYDLLKPGGHIYLPFTTLHYKEKAGISYENEQDVIDHYMRTQEHDPATGCPLGEGELVCLQGNDPRNQIRLVDTAFQEKYVKYLRSVGYTAKLCDRSTAKQIPFYDSRKGAGWYHLIVAEKRG